MAKKGRTAVVDFSKIDETLAEKMGKQPIRRIENGVEEYWNPMKQAWLPSLYSPRTAKNNRK